MHRRRFLGECGLFALGALSPARRVLAAAPTSFPSLPPMAATRSESVFPSRRPPPAQRTFASTAVEARIAAVRRRIGNAELAWLFENCYPNTLDTTVTFQDAAGGADTFIITGDIPAMWLRDSTAQTRVYVSVLFIRQV